MGLGRTDFKFLRHTSARSDSRAGGFTPLNRINDLTGFTLIESLVAVTVFALTMTSIVGLFLAILRLEQKSRAVRLVEQHARFLSEFITREVRNGTLNYAGYTSGIAWPETTLQLLTLEDPSVTEKIYWDHDGTRGAVLLDKGSDSSDITGSEVDVQNLYFYIYPQSNPFGGTPGDQPRVTFTFTMKSSIGSRPEDQASLDFQTTVSLREYQ